MSALKSKDRDREIQRLYEDYLNTAKGVRYPSVGCAFAKGTVLLVVVPIIALGIISGGEDFGSLLFSDNVMTGALYCFGVPAFVAVLVNYQLARKRAETRLAEIGKEKPGFLEFYRLWKKQQDDETNQALGSLAAGALLSGAEELRRRERLRSDARIIRDELRKK